MRSTVRFVNSSHKTHQNLHTLVDGCYWHFVLDASLHLKRLMLYIICVATPLQSKDESVQHLTKHYIIINFVPMSVIQLITNIQLSASSRLSVWCSSNCTIIYLNQKHPRCKKGASEWPRLKQPMHAGKDVKSTELGRYF